MLYPVIYWSAPDLETENWTNERHAQFAAEVIFQRWPGGEGQACRMLSNAFTFKMFQYTVDPIWFGMELIITELILNKQKDQNEASQPYGQSTDVK